MKKFTGSQFKPTKWASADDKATFATKLCDFLLRGCPQGRYSSGFYRRLCQMFGFIAHYDVNGFWECRFAGPAERLETVKFMAEWVPVGDPTWTWSDVEREVREFIRENDLLKKYGDDYDQAVEKVEREKLEQLKRKYG